MKTFPLRVLAPERTFFDGACTSLTVPSIDGMYGLMAQHEDIVLAIVPGKLTLRDADGVEQIAAVSEGVAGEEALRREGGIARDVTRATCEVIGAFERGEGVRYLEASR